jgi:hypothetical protein
MKHFKEYLAESERTYHYRIKMVGDTPPNFLKDLEDQMQQFDIVKISGPKTTPVQLKPADFPAFSNDRVTSVDVEFRYPAIEPQIKQLAQIIGFDPNRIIMLTAAHEDSLDKEREKIEAENKNLLTDTDFPAPDKEQKALYKDYATGPYDHAVLKNGYRSDFTVAGGKTPKAQTTNDLPQGVKSPMTTIKRPAKPATGAQTRG